MNLELHPIAVHFPVALVIVSLVFDWGRWLTSRSKLLAAGFWGGTTPLLIAALIGAGVSVATGLSAGSSGPQSGPVKDLIESHETVAFIVTGALSLLTFWRVALRGRFPKGRPYLYLLFLLFTAGVLGYGAYLGGVMVYGHGVGLHAIP